MALNNNNKIRFSFFVFVCFIMVSCTNHDISNRNIFRYNESAGISSLDPAFAKNQSIMWPIHQLYNTLVELDSQLKVVPSLAKSWDFLDYNRTIVFRLRTDVYFHDDPVFVNGIGRKLVAADIVYSYNRLLDKRVASPGAWIFNDKIDSLDPFVAIDDSTFEIRLSSACPLILGILSMPYCSIVPKEAVIAYGQDFRSHPVGTGPFCFKVWEEGQALILKRNNRYFEKDEKGKKLPYLEGIKISFLDNKANEFVLFQQQKLDFINDIDPSFKDELVTKTGELKKQWVGKIRMNKHSYLNTEYLGILFDTSNALLKNSPLRIKKVRLAINYAIDRRKMLMYLRNSIGSPANCGFIPKGLPSFDNELVHGYDYNPIKAKLLLKESGFDEVNPMPIIHLLTVSTYVNVASFIANELNKVGIFVEVETVQKNLLFEQMSKGQVLFFRGSWIADYPDPSNFLSVFYSKNPSPPNYTRYSNKKYDSLFEQSFLETNDSLRVLLFSKMDNMIIEDAPIIPLWYDMVLHFVNPLVENFKPNSLNMLELKRVKKNYH